MADIYTSPAHEYKNGSTPATGTKANGEYFNDEFLRLYSNDVWLVNNKLLRAGGEAIGALTVKRDLICKTQPREVSDVVTGIASALSKVAEMETYKTTARKQNWRIIK